MQVRGETGKALSSTLVLDHTKVLQLSIGERLHKS